MDVCKLLGDTVVCPRAYVTMHWRNRAFRPQLSATATLSTSMAVEIGKLYWREALHIHLADSAMLCDGSDQVPVRSFPVSMIAHSSMLVVFPGIFAYPQIHRRDKVRLLGGKHPESLLRRLNLNYCVSGFVTHPQSLRLDKAVR